MALNRVGIVCALQAEARALRPVSPRHAQLASLADGTLLAVTGMGAVAAAEGARALVRAGVIALASWGLAGGLDPRLAPGAILLPYEVFSCDGLTVATSAPWRSRLSDAVQANHPLATGRLLSSPNAIGSPREKARLFEQTGAAAVDMESVAVGQVASTCAVALIAVRVIVDGARDALPRAVTAAADQAGHLRLGLLIGSLARAPADLPPLLRLAWRYRTASRSLARVARTGSLAHCAFAADNHAS